MTAVVSNLLEQGQFVTVRSRQWAVNEVKPSTLTTSALKPTFVGPQTLLALLSVEDEWARYSRWFGRSNRVRESSRTWRWLFPSSANLTDDAFTISMELGLLVMRRPLPGTWKSSLGG